MTVTKQNVQSAIQIAKAVADTIREAGSVPSGHLYAVLCGLLTLEQYQRVIEVLKSTGLVIESNHLLTWVEPTGVCTAEDPDGGVNDNLTSVTDRDTDYYYDKASK